MNTEKKVIDLYRNLEALADRYASYPLLKEALQDRRNQGSFKHTLTDTKKVMLENVIDYHTTLRFKEFSDLWVFDIGIIKLFKVLSKFNTNDLINLVLEIQPTIKDTKDNENN